MKETKTIQVYPSDAIINATIEEYGSFGWEVIGNQRCQEFEGTTHDYFDGSTTKHYSTFNKITFTREKYSPWYEEVSLLEKEYNATKDTVKSYEKCKPVLRELKLQGISAFAVGFMLYCFYIVPGIIYTIVRCSKKSKHKKKYKKELADYNAVYPVKINELNGKLSELRVRAEKCIAGRI